MAYWTILNANTCSLVLNPEFHWKLWVDGLPLWIDCCLQNYNSVKIQSFVSTFCPTWSSRLPYVRCWQWWHLSEGLILPSPCWIGPHCLQWNWDCNPIHTHLGVSSIDYNWSYVWGDMHRLGSGTVMSTDPLLILMIIQTILPSHLFVHLLPAHRLTFLSALGKYKCNISSISSPCPPVSGMVL